MTQSPAPARPWPIAVNLVIAVVAGAFAVVLMLVAAFYAYIQGTFRVVLASFVVATVAAALRARRRSRRHESPFTWAARVESVRRFVVAALAVCGVAFVVAIGAYARGARRPPQETIAAAFREHRRDFEDLRDMVRSDGLLGVVEGGEQYEREPLIFRPPAAAGVSASRADLYRRRMEAAGVPRIDVWGNGSVHFAMASWGAANRGWRMSLVWSKERPTPLLPTVDGFQPGSTRQAYGAIGDDWYVQIRW